MRQSITLTILVALSVAASLAATDIDAARSLAAVSKPPLSSTYGRIPLGFEANRGQADPQVKFLTRCQGYTLFLTPTEAVLVPARGSSESGPDRPARLTMVGELAL